MEADLASSLISKSCQYVMKKTPSLNLEEPDRRRLITCLQLISGKTLLDVGMGKGILVNSAFLSKKLDSITAVDVRKSPNARLKRGIKFIEKSLISGEFVNERFDTVVCMEVLEHLESKFNSVMLTNLRESTDNRLIVTVPFNEPEPLWWHDKPGGHRQKFTLKQLAHLFPNAIATIEPRWGVEWIFIVEDKSLDFDYFKIVSKDKFLEILK